MLGRPYIPGRCHSGRVWKAVLHSYWLLAETTVTQPGMRWSSWKRRELAEAEEMLLSYWLAVRVAEAEWVGVGERHSRTGQAQHALHPRLQKHLALRCGLWACQLAWFLQPQEHNAVLGRNPSQRG